MRRDRPTAPRPREVISRQLRDCILDCGLSATALAREAGVDPRMVQRFLNSERDITLGTVDLLAEPLGLRLVQSGRSRSLAKPGRVGTPRDPRRAVRPAQPRGEDLPADADDGTGEDAE